ncbi:hypothetical protein [Cryptosporangium phraense]|uniref:Uncharacterized protein n=1 Tax=Cryptosporangium phraense TaxID=2593070 RepID=A0A545AUY6_9ACTN|nr:hypothetical protein [Cryptosporangium phraense]TQS45142.1 hypothetical protein FL583_11655 [Cryptosporangium phraense]
MNTRTTTDPTPPSLLPMRSALIIVIALLVGAVMGGLTLWGGTSLPVALVAGLSTAGISLLPLDRIVGR